MALLEEDWPRLITLTGPGGVGKTRLALAAAERVQERFCGAVWFIDLTPVGEASFVVPNIARTLGVIEGQAIPPLDALAAFVADRKVLLLLDNVEQVVAAAPDIDTLVGRCPGLRVLLTSRAPLNLRREQIVQVQPLPVPDAHLSSWTVESLRSVPSVDFFVDRALAAGPAFLISEANAGVVAELTRRLDGLPLAIELAAARTRCLEPTALLERVEQGLACLRWNTPDLLPRHRTLRSTLDWSYELLNREEQAVFRCLGVFAGRLTIDAVSAVAQVDDLDVDTLETLSSLTDKHPGSSSGHHPEWPVIWSPDDHSGVRSGTPRRG